MKNIRGYFRRYNLALRGRDDHRLIERSRAPLAAVAEELGAERVRLVRQLADVICQRDALTTQRDALVVQHAELATQRNALVVKHGELATQYGALVVQHDKLAEQHGALVVQHDKLAEQHGSLVVQHDKLAAQHGELVVRHDEFATQHKELESRHDQTVLLHTELVSQIDRQTAQMNRLVTQDAAKSSIIVERDRLAAQLVELVSTGEDDHRLILTKKLENLRSRYLDLMESALTGVMFKDPPIPIFGRENFDESIRDRGLDWPKNAYSMIGRARMRNFRSTIERVILGAVPGDIVETGVWRGGGSILARAVLAAYGVTDRKVILADSFEGLPPPDNEHYPADEGSNFHEFPELAVSLEQVRDNFEKFALLDNQVVFLKGWFKDTMPQVPTKQIAVLRLDGDMYESTIDPLKHLFDKVSARGWVIVDDYEWVPACKAAVDDFLSERGLKPDIQQIDGVGVFFQKS